MHCRYDPVTNVPNFQCPLDVETHTWSGFTLCGYSVAVLNIVRHDTTCSKKSTATDSCNSNTKAKPLSVAPCGAIDSQNHRYDFNSRLRPRLTQDCLFYHCDTCQWSQHIIYKYLLESSEQRRSVEEGPKELRPHHKRLVVWVSWGIVNIAFPLYRFYWCMRRAVVAIATLTLTLILTQTPWP